MISVKEVALSSGLSKQSIFNNLNTLGISTIKIKNVSYIEHEEDIERLLIRLEDNNRGILSKILDGNNGKIRNYVVKLVNEDKVSGESNLAIKVDNVINKHDDSSDNFVNNIDKLMKTNQQLKQELSSLNKQNEIIELLKSQIEDIKKSNEKEILRLEEDKKHQIQQLNKKDEQIKQLNSTLDEQQRLLHNQQSLQLQSNEKIKSLEIELKEIIEEKNRNVQPNKIDSFYKDIRNEKTEKKNESFIRRFFKR